jgi:hypothetical protein
MTLFWLYKQQASHSPPVNLGDFSSVHYPPCTTTLGLSISLFQMVFYYLLVVFIMGRLGWVDYPKSKQNSLGFQHRHPEAAARRLLEGNWTPKASCPQGLLHFAHWAASGQLKNSRGYPGTETAEAMKDFGNAENARAAESWDYRKLEVETSPVCGKWGILRS